MADQKQPKDFDRYAFFRSRARNYAICYQPELKEVDAYGQQREVQPAIRIEFHNGMKRLEKTKENQPFIDFLRKRIEKEQDMDPRSRTIWEETPPDNISRDEHKKELEEKDKEIEELRKKVEQGQTQEEQSEENNTPLQAKQKTK